MIKLRVERNFLFAVISYPVVFYLGLVAVMLLPPILGENLLGYLLLGVMYLCPAVVSGVLSKNKPALAVFLGSMLHYTILFLVVAPLVGRAFVESDAALPQQLEMLLDPTLAPRQLFAWMLVGLFFSFISIPFGLLGYWVKKRIYS